MHVKISPDFISQRNDFLEIIKNFNTSGIYFTEPVRNAIKIFELDSKKINVKSFKVPTLLNSIIYGYFRKSKAERSFEYATILLEKNINTPQPIAFFENKSSLGLKDSYYFSEQLDVDLTFRELTRDENYPNSEEIIKQYTQFAYHLFEKKIEFIDNTSGNILIKKTASDQYDFFLVDLNRMNFETDLSLQKRIQNLAKLTNNDYIVRTISLEYAKLSGENPGKVYELLTAAANNFQERFKRKRRLKKKLFFWRQTPFKL